MPEPDRPLWAPWRVEYVRGPKAEGCVFCRALAAGEDREHLVLHRGESTFVVLNRFPYTSGHLMVVPRRHVALPEDLSAAEASELWAMLATSKRALDAFLAPQGYNVGLNLGAAAGAGVADHLHLHVVPRWVGDTNFMPVIGDVRVVSQHLLDVYDGLAARFSTDRAEAHGRGGARG
ncbi:MAG: HIT domain-containing protein [Deltaproteobacteria bacterium]|nr:HIT domain-containing protein [Deltaproteobacteria bacterium]